MRCYVCENSNWHLFDKEFIGWPDSVLGVCKECGVLAYQIEPEAEKKLKDYYRHDYRGVIGPSNLITTSRKLNYIRLFIGDWLTEKEKDGVGGLKKMIVGDIGCATGYIVDWFRQRGHKATGSEWTITMRRFANHFYGLPITEEISEKHKYDILVSYHTLEHMIEPDKKLIKFVSLLADDGHMLISTPRWLHILDESGVGRVSDFKTLMHKDHINCYSKNVLNNLFKKAGLEIIKEDHVSYGQTYLLKKAKPSTDFIKEDYKDVIDILERQKKAIDVYKKATKPNGDVNLFREALNIYPKYPDCYYDWVLNSTQKKDRGRCAELIEEASKVMPQDAKIKAMRAYFLYQNEEWAASLEDFDYLCNTKLNEDVLMFKGYNLYHLGRYQEAMNVFNNASVLNPQKWTEAMVWMCKCATQMPTWDEQAIEKIKQEMFNKANIELKPNDPLFQENGKQDNKPIVVVPNKANLELK